MWWKNTVFYQIYIPGFKDSNRDGIGDFKGLISELPYLADLGIGALWLTPFYPSPLVDNGYDISNYCDVNLLFGSIEDFDLLIREGEIRGLKIIIDIVLNHSSVQHPWFQESRLSLTSAKRDWYIWRSELPNNWESYFGGSAWEYDPLTNEYYYHAFAPEMADLNWECPEVRMAMYDIFRFWLDRGVKGFRLDVINFLKAGLKWNNDNPVIGGRQAHIYDINSPGLARILRDLRALTKQYGDIYLLGEVGSEDSETLASYVGSELLDTVFNFNLGSISMLDYSKIRKELESYNCLYSFPLEETSLFFSSHDMSRFATRLCGGKISSIKGLSALILTGPGIPFLYQGDELGIGDYNPENPAELYDTKAIHVYGTAIHSGMDKNAAFSEAMRVGRDYSRALYFSDNRNINSEERPCVPQRPPFGEKVRRKQQRNHNSILFWIIRLIDLRNGNRTFTEGDFNVLSSSQDHLVFRRNFREETWIIGINNGKTAVSLEYPIKADLIYSSRSHIREEVLNGPIILTEVPGEITLIFRVQ